ncbi:branched-chain amino acid ABC transporter permease [Geoalkalibacter sp.]|uniref:branched-chain amino acid ABC transporter permease n=1 Tax=Geoalkalibacter sp. TaxID=3041440 RepID=UPI00272EE1DB|nr:branched-chain amino acid ABC transporter permease [Geoalkalibacter sp.]
MEIFIQLLLNGLLLGGMYAIISIGLTLIFGVIRVVNFAHGELLMIGMYAVYLLTKHLDLHPYVSAGPVIVLLFIIGAAIQRFIIQPLLSADPEIQIFATVGLSTALMNLALLVFGANMFSVNVPALRNTVNIGQISLLNANIVMFASAVTLVFLLHYFLTKTYFGKAIRATSQNRFAAPLMGINVNRVYIVTFGIGSACVGLAAALVMPIYTVFPTIGTYFVLTAFVIVVLGGMGSIFGAFIGAMIIGIIDSISGYYIAPDLKEVVYFLIFIAILIFRPTGLLGLGKGSE